MQVDLAADTATGEGADTLAGIESAIGSSFADDLTGGAGPNALTGGPGTDTLVGGAGDDALTGGPGTDTVTYVGLRRAGRRRPRGRDGDRRRRRHDRGGRARGRQPVRRHDRRLAG